MTNETLHSKRNFASQTLQIQVVWVSLEEAYISEFHIFHISVNVKDENRILFRDMEKSLVCPLESNLPQLSALKYL